jgi:uncharacterized lipoprotein YddW (UPF0748 family)
MSVIYIIIKIQRDSAVFQTSSQIWTNTEGQKSIQIMIRIKTKEVMINIKSTKTQKVMKSSLNTIFI